MTRVRRKFEPPIDTPLDKSRRAIHKISTQIQENRRIFEYTTLVDVTIEITAAGRIVNTELHRRNGLYRGNETHVPLL